ncbi:hypothetical protein FGRMN_3756 [Fusarium graminum]|nr:hypothetical protein FGRMN_3756 [Fusarium graminum]
MGPLPSTTTERLLALFIAYIGFYFVYMTILAVYRLTFHPLAAFPGPFLCRISWHYQMYFEAIKGGKMLERLPGLHEKYGPIVRINPNEVHIKDPEVFHEIYGQKTKFTKDPFAYSFGVPTAINVLLDPIVHRQRREMLNPSFSKRRINMLEDLMYEELDRVFEKITEYANKGMVIPIQEAYYCYAGDIISRVIFGKCLNLIDMPDFATDKIEEIRGFTKGVWISIHFGAIRNLMMNMPQWLVRMMNESWVGIIDFTEHEASEAMKNYHRPGREPKSARDETIFDRLLDANQQSEKERGMKSKFGLQELTDEGVSLLIAGLETTATTITYATYYFQKYPHVQPRIMEELSSIKPDTDGRMPIKQIEAQPYFAGFVKETLRFSHGIPGRLTRVVPEGGLVVPAAGKTIPAGSVVGMSHLMIHKDPELFESPEEFKPERWLGDEGKALDHWLVSFSKGTRDCIGKNLAFTEMHLILANVFMTYDIELCPGSDEAMVMTDRAIARPTSNLRVNANLKVRTF